MHCPGACVRQETLTRGETEELSYNADARTAKTALESRDSTRVQQQIRMLNLNTTSIQHRNIAAMHELLSMQLAISAVSAL
jgi:hypothetical protein